MDNIENKIKELEEKIEVKKVITEASQIINEMKKVGIEKLPYS